MARKIIDVTQLVHWAGPLTGIPRVMYELAVRFHRHDAHDTIFAAWIRERREFCEIDLLRTLAQQGRRAVFLHAREPSKILAGRNTPPATIPSARPLATLLPRTLRRLAKTGLALSRRISRGLAHRIERRGQAVYMRYVKDVKPVELGRDDRLIIPRGEWADAGFIATLRRAHERSRTSIVHIVHDMTPIVVPQFTSGNATEAFLRYCRQILPITSLVLCNSQSSKRDAVAWLTGNRLTPPRVEVFRLGDDFRVTASVKPRDPRFEASGLNGHDFILCVGTIEPRKNHAVLYYAYKLSNQRRIVLPKVVIVGRRGWGSDDIVRLLTEDPDVKNNFVLLLNTSDDELSWLYEHCLFTVFPSFYEGWGIPIAESLARGVPCLCSDTSSMVEIAEGHVAHFSPASSDECLAGMQRLLDPVALKEARERAARYTPFSWDASFAQVRAHLEDVE